MSEPDFAIEEYASEGNLGLVLRGSMRMADSSLLQNTIARICEGRRTRILLDLRELTAIDSTGMHCLISAFETSRERGHDLEVVPGSEIHDVHDLIGLLAELPLLARSAGRDGRNGH